MLPFHVKLRTIICIMHKSAFAVSICGFKSLDMKYGLYAIENLAANGMD